MKILGPIFAVVLFIALAVQIGERWHKLPLDVLNENLAYANFEGLFLLEEGKSHPCSRHDLEKSRRYFKQVTALMPGLADAWGMLGFCHFYLGESDEAMRAFSKAIAINPRFWGFYYNLGVVYWQKNDAQKAAENFQKALSCPVQLSALFIGSSKVYADLVQKSKHRDLNIAQHLQDDYKLTLLALRLSQSQERTDFPLRLF